MLEVKEVKNDGSLIEEERQYKEVPSGELRKQKDNRSEDERKKKAAKAAERKIQALSNIDSIYIFPFSREGFSMANMARTADFQMLYIKRNFGIRIDIEKAKKIFKDFEVFCSQLWNFVYSIAPNLHNIPPSKWRELNDTMQQKTVLANHKSTVVILPRSEESGQIAMAVKIIQSRNIELRQSSSLVDLEKFVMEYIRILKNFDILLSSVANKTEQQYKSFLVSETSEGNTTKGNTTKKEGGDNK